MGLSALEVVRIEAGFIMPGFDFNIAEATIRDGFDRSPYEAGLGWIVHLDKGPLYGTKGAARRESADLQNDASTRSWLTATNRWVMHSSTMVRRASQCGEVKCTTWSPILKANLALADIEYANGRPPADLWARIDYQRELKWLSTWAKCRIESKPFYSPAHRTATPPANY